MLKINMDINKPATHKNKHRFLVNLDPSKTPSIFSGENLLETSSIFLFQVQEKYIYKQNKTVKYNLSLQRKTPWKLFPLCLDFHSHLKMKICTIRIRTVLYGLCTDFMDFLTIVRIFQKKSQKLLSNSVQITTLNDVRTIPFVVFYALISVPNFA